MRCIVFTIVIVVLMFGSTVVADSPGIPIGTTYYDMQTIGPSGNRITVASEGGKFISWINLLGWPYPPAPRGIYYSWIEPDGNIFGDPLVSQGGGQPMVDAFDDNRIGVSYYALGGNDPTYVTFIVLSDLPYGYIDIFDPPDTLLPQNPDNPGQCYWSYLAIDRSNRVHLTMHEDTPWLGYLFRIGYTMSLDAGPSWIAPKVVDTTTVISSVVDASLVSDRVAVAFCKPVDTTSQWQNDIVYVVSEDSENWDFALDQINVTNYADDSDSLWAYLDLDIIFDYNDYLHIVWNDQWVTDTIYPGAYLKHYSESTGEISEISYQAGSSWSNICGAWNRPICKMNLGASPDGGVFVIWTQFDVGDVSAAGYGNGDIYLSYSYDGGANWSTPENITDSQTPGCYSGDCDNDHWGSLADNVGDSLYLTYIDDKDAGSIMMSEGTATLNPVKYLALPTPANTNVTDEPNNPDNFAKLQNYPNPFNAETVISFSLEEQSHVSLDIYDITGAKIATLANRVFASGSHKIKWLPKGISSGVYLYKLQQGEVSLTRKAVYLR